MSAGPLYEFHQGDYVNIDTTVYDDDDLTTVKDVSGASVEGTIGLKKTGIALFVVAGSVVDGPNGVVRFTLLPAQTVEIPPRDYDVQVQVTLDSQPGVVADEKFRVHRKLEA